MVVNDDKQKMQLKFNIITAGATTLTITTFSIPTTLSIKGLFVTLNINDSQHKQQSVKPYCVIMLSVILSVASY